MFKKILVATDASEQALRACREAAGMAKAFGSEVTLIYVVYLPPMYKTDVGPGIRETLVDDGKEILQKSKEEADASGIEAKVKLIREGNPAEVIVKESKSGAYDLIVIGSSGLGRAGALQLGSVSVRVADDADCSVLIIK